MPRREQPLESGDEVLLRLARDLRGLREKAGSPTYRQLSTKAHYSPAALSEAAGGRKLPTLAVTLAYVRACDGDRAAWEARWREAAADIALTDSVKFDRNVSEQAPYVGTATFDVADADRFRGRDKPLEHLLSQMRDHRLIAVFGASGSGKSSFLRAGLAASLSRDGRPVVIFTPGSDPVEECAVHLAAAVGRSPAELRAELAADPANLHLHIRQALAERPGVDLTLIVDQFEDVLADEARDWLIDALTGAALTETSRAQVVLGISADTRDRCERHPKLAAAHPFPLPPMTADELRQAITEPAVQAGYRVETALVSELIAVCARAPGSLPLLSRALLETWHRRQGATLTLAGYQATGTIPETLARTAEEVHTTLDEAQHEAAKQIFLRLTELGDRTEDSARRVDRTELTTGDPDTPTVLDQLARARIITLDRDTVELTHDSLIRTWPRLRDWLAEDRPALLVQRELTRATRTWESLDHDPGALYRGTRLEAAQHLTSTLTPRERDFLRASLSASRHDVRGVRRLVALLIATVLIAATVISLVIVNQQRDTERQHDAALAESVLRAAAAMRDTNPALALQLSLAAYRLDPNPATRSNLYEMMATPYATRIPSVAAVAAVRPDGQVVATGGAEKETTLWNITNPNRPIPLATIPVGPAPIQFSPDGKTLAVGGQLWDVENPSAPHELGAVSARLVQGTVLAEAFNSDGDVLATLDLHGTVELWNVTDRLHPQPLKVLAGGGADNLRDGAAIAFSPDGHILAATDRDQRVVRLWDVTKPANPLPLGTLTGHTGVVFAVAFHPNSPLMATASQDTTARLWNIADPVHPVPVGQLTGHGGAVRAVAFGPGGYTLATGADDRTTWLWDITEPNSPRPQMTVTGHLDGVSSVAFAQGGRLLVTTSLDETARLTDISTLALADHAAPVHDLAFGRDGQLASASSDRTVRLWNLADRDHLKGPSLTYEDDEWKRVRISPSGSLVATSRIGGTSWLWDVSDTSKAQRKTALVSSSGSAVQFSPDPHLIAVSRPGEGTTELLDITDPTSPRSLATLSTRTEVAAFSPDGHLLAATNSDGRPELWNLADPRKPRSVATLAATGTPVGFSPDGHLLAVVNTDGTTGLWDVTDLARPVRISVLDSGISSSPETRVAFSADGHLLATAGDKTVRLWDLTDPYHPAENAVLRGHTADVRAVAFSPDGATIATAGDDRVIRLWDTDVERLASRICQLTNPRITTEEWQHYLPGKSYQPPCF